MEGLFQKFAKFMVEESHIDLPGKTVAIPRNGIANRVARIGIRESIKELGKTTRVISRPPAISERGGFTSMLSN